MKKFARPPKLADRLLTWFCKPELLEEIQGDLHADYERRCAESSKRKANIRYWVQVLNFMRPFALKKTKTINHMGMLKNHFKIAWRTSLRNKGYSIINLSGLAVGLASFILISTYVYNELTYDRFHNAADHIYRVVVDVERGEVKSEQSNTPGALRMALINEVPEIEHVTQLHPGFWGKTLVWNDKYKYYNKGVFFADESFFEVFSFEFLKGNPATVLQDKHSIVLTESTAIKFFGTKEAIGQTLTLEKGKSLKVTGVIKDIPKRSHLKFDLLLSRELKRPQWSKNWGSDRHMRTYIKLLDQADLLLIDDKIQNIMDRNGKKAHNDEVQTYFTQPLAGMDGIHLSPRMDELAPPGSFVHLKALVVVGFFLLLIAGINYLNMATARSAVRVREIGVRKVTGAQRSSLICQFLVESTVLSLIAGLLAMGLATAILPFFNQLVQRDFSFFEIDSTIFWLGLPVVIILFGILAGLYPAFYLSAFKPISILKKSLIGNSKGFNLRKTLVVTQFSISAFLLVGMIVVQKQMKFLQSRDLGFDKDQILVIQNFNNVPKRDINYTAREELSKIPGVAKVGASLENMLGTRGTSTGFMQATPDGTKIPSLAQFVDDGYLETLGLEFTEGRNFSRARGDGKNYRVILNETAVKQMGLESPVVGQTILNWNGTKNIEIIGVVKDFHSSSLHHEIVGYTFYYAPDAWNVVVKLTGGSIFETVAQIDEVWKKFGGDAPMDYYFLDESINREYQAEMNFRTLFFWMTGLALFVASLGLFGLVAFMAQQRTKEIGIRKVLGASVSSLILLLGREFVILVTIANFIAWPLAFTVMDNWLANFAYRVSIEWGVFALSALSALLIAALTVGFQTLRTAKINPVNSLRDE